MPAERTDLDPAKFDAIAADLGMPEDWRAIGYDTPEYMVSANSVYIERNHIDQPTGRLKCPFPACTVRLDTVEAMFRHAHGPRHIGRTAD